MFERLRNRFPILSRIGGALFDAGGEFTLPPERNEDGEPITAPITVSRPKGILRSKAVIVSLIGIVYWLARIFGFELPMNEASLTNAVTNLFDAAVTIVGFATAAWARIKATNLTRG